MVPTTEDYLKHYGVLGMKWGKRKREDDSVDKPAKPEKVVDAETQAKREKRAAKYQGRADESAQTIKELDDLGITSPKMRELYGKAVNQSDRMFRFTQGTSKENAIAEARKDEERNLKIATKDAENVADGGWSRGQKIALGVGIGVAALAVAYGAYKYKDIVTANAAAGEPISVSNFLKRYGKAAADFTNPITKEQFEGLSTLDVSVPKGTTFQRLATDANEDMARRLYVTFNGSDNDRYTGIYGAALRARTGVKELHINKMVSNVEVKSPSHKARVQAFMDLISQDKQYAMDPEDPTQMFTVRQMLDPTNQWGPLSPKEMANNGALAKMFGRGALSDQDFALKHYNDFARRLVVNDGASNAYFDVIKQMGYNALVDDNDRAQLSDVPMILLNAKEVIESRTSTVLTTQMEKEARKRLVALLG